MPSGHKKRKSTKRKNKTSVSPPHQGLLRTHMNMLQAPSFGNGAMGKEKHGIAEKEAVGNGDKEKGEESFVFEFKGGEDASSSEMDASGNEGNLVSSNATAGILSEAENSQKIDALKMSALDKSADELQETDKLELFGLNGFLDEPVTSDTRAGWTGGLEKNDREDNNREEVDLDDSVEEVMTSQVNEYVPVTKEGDVGQGAVKKEEAILANVVEASVCDKEDKEEKVMIDAHGFMERTQDDEKDTIAPETEIPRPPMLERRASLWNCCGLFQVFMTSQR